MACVGGVCGAPNNYNHGIKDHRSQITTENIIRRTNLRDCKNYQPRDREYSGNEPICQCRRCKRWGFNLWVWKIPWRRVWQPTPVCLPGESHGQRSLADFSLWGCKELDTTERLSMHILYYQSLLILIKNCYYYYYSLHNTEGFYFFFLFLSRLG